MYISPFGGLQTTAHTTKTTLTPDDPEYWRIRRDAGCEDAQPAAATTPPAAQGDLGDQVVAIMLERSGKPLADPHQPAPVAQPEHDQKGDLGDQVVSRMEAILGRPRGHGGSR